MGVARVDVILRRGRISLSQERTGGSQPTWQRAQHSKRGENLKQLHFRGFHLRTATMLIPDFTAPAREHLLSLPVMAGVVHRPNGPLSLAGRISISEQAFRYPRIINDSQPAPLEPPSASRNRASPTHFSLSRILRPANHPQAWGHGGRMEGVWRDSDVGRTTSWYC